MSISNYSEGIMLATLPATVYVKLHIGDPGEAGTSNAAANTTRKAVTLDAAVSGSRTSSTAAAWSAGEVTTTETYSHASLWDASVAGNCLFTGALGARVAVTAGSTFTIAATGLVVTLD